jgi:hypothetical protein
MNQNVIDSPSVAAVERQGDEMGVVMTATTKRLPLFVLSRELRTLAARLFIADLAQQSPPKQSHRRKRPLHEGQDISLLVCREREQCGSRLATSIRADGGAGRG